MCKGKQKLHNSNDTNIHFLYDPLCYSPTTLHYFLLLIYIGREEARNRKIKNNNRSLGGINVSIYIYILVALLIFCYFIFLFWKIPRISEKEIEYTMFRIQKDFLDDLNFGLKQACENFTELGFCFFSFSFVLEGFDNEKLSFIYDHNGRIFGICVN